MILIATELSRVPVERDRSCDLSVSLVLELENRGTVFHGLVKKVERQSISGFIRIKSGAIEVECALDLRPIVDTSGQPFSNPFGSAPPESDFPLVQLGSAVTGTTIARNAKTPYTQQFNISVQLEPLHNTILQIA
jgi:hypothetical protein